MNVSVEDAGLLFLLVMDRLISEMERRFGDVSPMLNALGHITTSY